MKKHPLIFFILSLLYNLLFAQEEYFVRVNPATCNYTIIDSLPGVKWIASGSAFDKINNRYIFEGADINYNDYLYNINATNGNIISNPPWINYLSLIKFDNATGILYGIHWTTTLAAGADFVSINPTNLTYSIIHQINLTGLSGDVTFDDMNHRFIFVANDSIGNNCLFCVNAITGNVISKPLLSGDISGIQFDNSTGNLYGLQWDNSLQTEYFDSINIINGMATIISSIALVNANHNYSTFDEINKRYTFVWTDSSNNKYLYTINATNGQVISNPLFPVFISPYNLLEFRYDNSTGNLYALHWGPYSDSTGGVNEVTYQPKAILYQNAPNPFNDGTTIKYFVPDNADAQIVFYDMFGNQLRIFKIVEKGMGQLNVSATNLAAGIYSYSLIINGKVIDTKKMVRNK